MKLKAAIRDWLEIKEPEKVPKPKDWTEDFNKLEAEQWRNRQLLKKRAAGKCEGCKKLLMLWPLETEAYYTKDGRPWHVNCYAAAQKEVE